MTPLLVVVVVVAVAGVAVAGVAVAVAVAVVVVAVAVAVAGVAVAVAVVVVVAVVKLKQATAMQKTQTMDVAQWKGTSSCEGLMPGWETHRPTKNPQKKRKRTFWKGLIRSPKKTLQNPTSEDSHM